MQHSAIATKRPPARLEDAARFAAWAFTPFQRLAARALYGLLATRAFTVNGLYLNLGYWMTARTIDEACAALAMLVADAAGMRPDDDVVDISFDFGDQDMLWMERVCPRQITGLNITPMQMRLARQRVRRRDMASGPGRWIHGRSSACAKGAWLTRDCIRSA